MSHLHIRTLAELGDTVQMARHEQRLKATHAATRSGRSRDLLHRLATGGGITTGAMLDVLRIMGTPCVYSHWACPRGRRCASASPKMKADAGMDERIKLLQVNVVGQPSPTLMPGC